MLSLGLWLLSAQVASAELQGGLSSAPSGKPGAVTEAKDGEEKVVEKTVTGELTVIGRGAISVEVSKTKTESTEMLLPINEETQLQRVRSLAELKPGDTVRVTYEQSYREDEHGELVILKTVATLISLVRNAPKRGLDSREQAE